MVQIITQQGGGGGGGGGTSYIAGCGIDITNNEISIDTSVVAEKSDLNGYQTVSCMVCDLTGADDSHYPTAKAVADAISSGGGGDMLKSVYDPNNVNADAFDYCNFSNTPTIPTDNCQLANGCGYAKTCDIPTDNCQLANGCGYTTCTGTLTASNISNTAYGSSWSGVTTVAPSKNAVYAKVSAIDALIPSAATCSNQLADKDYVNDSINSVTAFYITKNAAGDQFATYAELAAATTFYSGGAVRVPTRNDYAIVLDDETHNDEVTRYIYNSGWEYQYTINESPLTTAQLNALNSGITSTKVGQYDTAVTTIGGYGDIVTHNASEFATSAQGGLADTALQPGDNISDLNNDAGYLTTAPVTSVNGQTGAVTVEEGITKIFTLSSTSDLTNAQAAYDYYLAGGNPIIKYSGGTSPNIFAGLHHLGRVYGGDLRFEQTYGTFFQGGDGVSHRSIRFVVTNGSVTSISTYSPRIIASTSQPGTGTSVNTITLVI